MYMYIVFSAGGGSKFSETPDMVSCTLTQVPDDYSGPYIFQYQGGGLREYAPRSRREQALVPSRPSRVRGEAGPSFFPAGRLTPAGVPVENLSLAAVHWQLNPGAKRNS